MPGPLHPTLCGRTKKPPAVAHALAGQAVIGPGVVARTCAALQREYFDPPLEAAGSGRPGVGKYGRTG